MGGFKGLLLCFHGFHTIQKDSVKGQTRGSNSVGPLLANSPAILCLSAQLCLLSLHFSAYAQRGPFSFLICRKTPNKQSFADSANWKIIRIQDYCTAIYIYTPAIPTLCLCQFCSLCSFLLLCLLNSYNSALSSFKCP